MLFAIGVLLEGLSWGIVLFVIAFGYFDDFGWPVLVPFLALKTAALACLVIGTSSRFGREGTGQRPDDFNSGCSTTSSVTQMPPATNSGLAEADSNGSQPEARTRKPATTQPAGV